MHPPNMATPSQSEILKSKPIGEGLNGFRDSHNSAYEVLNSEGNVPQPLVEIIFKGNRAERCPSRHDKFSRKSSGLSSTVQPWGQEPPRRSVKTYVSS